MLPPHYLHPSLEECIQSALFKCSALPRKSWEGISPCSQCVCAHMHCIHENVKMREPVCAHGAQSRVLAVRTLSDTLIPLILSFTDQNLAVSVRLTYQQPLRVYLCLPPSARFLGPYSQPSILHGCWKFELKSLCLQSKHNYPLSRIISPLTPLTNSKEY